MNMSYEVGGGIGVRTQREEGRKDIGRRREINYGRAEGERRTGRSEELQRLKGRELFGRTDIVI